MGFLTGSTKIYVSSSAYNLGGDLLDRPNFLKTSVAHSVLFGDPKGSLAGDIVKSQMAGPTFSQRSFFRWSRDNYALGQLTGSVNTKSALDPEVIRPFIPDPTATINSAFLDSADITYWAEQYVADTRPDMIGLAWVADYDSQLSLLTIDYPDESSDSTTVSGFNPSSDYAYAYYTPNLGSLTIFIYELGTGTAALDDLLQQDGDALSEFFPVIPLRVDNKPLTDPIFDADFALYKKAYKRSVGASIDDILLNIEDNENVGDIDHAFVVHGVELNSEDRNSKRYLYEFLKNLMANQSTTIGETEAYLESLSSGNPTTLPSVSSLELKTDSGANLPYRIVLHWLSIGETFNVGLGKVGAKKNDIWWEVSGTAPVNIGSTYGTIDDLKLYWQYSATSYKYLTIHGLLHENIIYGSNSVRITGIEALGDAEPTGFVLPLHYPSLKEMSLVSANELVVSSKIVVFNSYLVVKQKWYQTLLFRIIVVVIVAVVAGPAGYGVLGTNASIGSLIGLSGTAAVIGGAVINAIAAMIIMEAITQISIAVFGDKLGAIIGAVLSVLAITQISSYNATGSFTLNWGDMSKIDNIMKLTSVVSDGIQAWAGAEMSEIGVKMQEALEEYGKDSDEIEKLTAELLGYSGADINPLMFTDVQDSSLSAVESSAGFLSRTLLTGSEICDLSFDMISSFPELTLRLPQLND